MDSGVPLSATIPLEADDSDGSGAERAPMEDRLACGLLVLLAFVLPFELPLFRLGPIQITTVELALYTMLAGWGLAVGCGTLRGRPWLKVSLATLRREALVQAAIGWTVVLFVSAAIAPSHRAAALKFALRSLSGILAFFAARMLARSPAAAGRVVWALVAGAELSALTALIDWTWSGSASAWQLFRSGTFDTVGLERASGVFAYPTIGAMYWEAVMPLVIVAPLLSGGVRSRRATMRATVFAVLANTVLVLAILASATRSGLVGATTACVALGGLAWRSGMPSGVHVSRAAAGTLGVLVVSLALALHGTTPGSLLGQRLRWWQDESWLRAEYRVGLTPKVVGASEPFAVPVRVRNTGTLIWRRSGPRPTRLAYHWERIDGSSTVDDFEGIRTDLPADVSPGGSAEVLGAARGPRDAGTYLLRWDLVQEGVSWFSEQGSAMPAQRVEVSRTTTVTPSVRVPRDPVTPPPPSRPALWRAAVVLWRERPLLGIGPDNFRRRYEAVLSPAPNGLPYTDTRLHANSLYFETLADLGLAGMAVLVWIALALARTIREHRRARRITGLACGVAAGVFFVHGTLDYFFEFTPLFGLFWVLLGVTAACESEPPSSAALRGSTPSARAR